jgi:hypothetical protein
MVRTGRSAGPLEPYPDYERQDRSGQQLEADARAPGQFQAAMAGLHSELLVALTAADFRLGKAYGLGRALAETALLPDARNPQTFRRLFARHRLANLLEWLADLKSAFPPHPPRASVGHCRPGRLQFVVSPPPPFAAGSPGRLGLGGRPRERDPSVAPPRPAVAGHPLWREGMCRSAVWRRYVEAADRLLGHLRRLTLDSCAPLDHDHGSGGARARAAARVGE